MSAPERPARSGIPQQVVREHRVAQGAERGLVAPALQHHDPARDDVRLGADLLLLGLDRAGVGAGVRLFFPLARGPTLALGARIVRVAIDHLGIEFGGGQEAQIAQLIEGLSPD